MDQFSFLKNVYILHKLFSKVKTQGKGKNQMKINEISKFISLKFFIKLLHESGG